MSPVGRRVAGEILSFVLADEMARVRRELETASGRIARTLVKNGPLSVTLVGVKPGGELKEHTARGPITIQVIEGSVEFESRGTPQPLTMGMLLSLDGGVPHSVTSERGAIFLLTVTAMPRS
jgi:quercetin dioxygenase-like cupin family protein